MLTEFKLIGRVGEIREVGSTLRVSVASSFSRRDNSGEWIDRTRWNELTIFGERRVAMSSATSSRAI
jgi:hypothetical protein